MKRFFLPLAVAALCGLGCADAASTALSAEVVPTLKATDAKLLPLQIKRDSEISYFGKTSDKVEAPVWYYVNVPYELRGKGEGPDDKPLYVDALDVHIHLAFDMGRRKKGNNKFVVIDKKIPYVELPLPDYDSSKKEGLNKNVNAAVFFSPADLAKLSDEIIEKGGKPDKISKVDLSKRLAAVAVEFYYKDVECTDKDVKKKDDYKKGVLAKPEGSNLGDFWWRNEHENVVAPRAISDTPFAPFYAQSFPPTTPLYGTGDSSGSSSSAASPGVYIPAAATESTAETGADVTADDSSKKKGKKRRK